MAQETPRGHFEAGKRFLKEEKLDRALRAFEKAYKQNRNNPFYMSYYGLCMALRTGKIGLGLDFCTRAIKKEYYRAEFYVNLGRVHLAAGNKKVAEKVFKKGLRYDPENPELKDYLAELGFRKRPVIPSLDRSNPINKFLGILLRRKLPELTGKKKR